MSSSLNTLTWHRPAELNGPWLEIELGILWQCLLSLEFHPYYLPSQLILHSASSAAVASDGLLKWRRVSPLKGCQFVTERQNNLFHSYSHLWTSYSCHISHGNGSCPSGRSWRSQWQGRGRCGLLLWRTRSVMVSLVLKMMNISTWNNHPDT